MAKSKRKGASRPSSKRAPAAAVKRVCILTAGGDAPGLNAVLRAFVKTSAQLGLEDLFRRFEQPKNAWSWWDYRMNAFRRDHGLRIDLMLASKPLAERCTACTIDRVPRTWERPSDHAPVIATFDIG